MVRISRTLGNRLEHKKGGAREGSPFSFGVLLLLESEPQTELQLAHAVRRVRGSIAFDVLNAAWIAAGAVDTSVALVRVESQHRVIEYVICVKAELRFNTLGEVEALRQRHIGEERTGSAIRIETHVTNRSASGQREGTGGRACQCAGIGASEVGCRR